MLSNIHWPTQHAVLASAKQSAAMLHLVQILPAVLMQIQGKIRERVAEAGEKLGLDGTTIALSCIELIQLG